MFIFFNLEKKENVDVDFDFDVCRRVWLRDAP